MNEFLWGVYPYLCIGLFFVVPVIRMVFRPYSWSSRASGLFNRPILGMASILMHWGLVLLLVGHLLGLFGGLVGSAGSMGLFYWVGLIGGVMVLIGSVMALIRRITVPEVRALSQVDDYVVHLFLIPIVTLALYQVLVHKIFGVAYGASSWAASLWTLSPQPTLMASASLITKWHIFLALTLFAYFPFTKLVHAWTYPVNYFVRPYQSMRTVHMRFQRKWELGLRSDKSWLIGAIVLVAVIFQVAGFMLGGARAAGVASTDAGVAQGELTGSALFVSQCARCHGLGGLGDGIGSESPTFGSPPRDFVAAEYRYISTNNTIASDADLRRAITVGFPASGMPAFDHLSVGQVDSLVSILDELWKDRPASGETIIVPPRPTITADTIAAGAGLYEVMCMTCHGEKGDGQGPSFVGLPTAPRDFTQGELKAGTDPVQMYLRTAAGIPKLMVGFGLGLDPNKHPDLPEPLTRLSPEQIWSIIDYVESEFMGGS